MSVSQLAPDDDAMLSHIYSLLNYIAATNRFSGVDDMGDFIQGTDRQTDYARRLTEEEKRLIAVSTISVVSRFDEISSDLLCSLV